MARHGYMVQDSGNGREWYNLVSCDLLDTAIAEACDIVNRKTYGKNWERYIVRVRELPTFDVVWGPHEHGVDVALDTETES